MNRKIANLLKDKISGVDFVDRISGLVQTVSVDVKSGESRVNKSYPVSCDLTHEECIKGGYESLTPDSKYKSVIYFEDLGVRYVRTEGTKAYYESSLKMVGWLNIKKLLSLPCSSNSCDVTACVITNIIQAYTGFPYHSSPFLHIYSIVVSQDVRDSNIFGKYTYNEKRTQYLMYPYDFFALNIQTAFAIETACVEPCFTDD